MLRFLGLGWWHHPDEGDQRNFPYWYLPYFIVTQLVWVVGFVGLETIDPFIGQKEVKRFMFSLSFVITHDLTLIKLYIFYFKNKQLQDVVKTLEIEMYDFYQNVEKNRKTVKTTRVMTFAFLFFGWFTIANSNINGVIQDIRWKSLIAELSQNITRPGRSLAQPIYIPWNFQNDKSYAATFVLEAVGLLWTGHIVMIIDTFIGSVILHMSSQFRTLQEAIETIYERAMLELKYGVEDMGSQNETHSTESSVEVAAETLHTEIHIEMVLEKAVNNCIHHHQVLIRCVQNFGNTYSYGFLTQLLSSMAAICVIMVQVSKDASTFKSISFATSLAFFITMILQLAIQCFTGNELEIQTTHVADAVMRSRWELLPPRLRRRLVLLMLRSQRPLRLPAAGFTYMNNACFLTIVKAAYSYYAVLSQKQN